MFCFLQQLRVCRVSLRRRRRRPKYQPSFLTVFRKNVPVGDLFVHVAHDDPKEEAEEDGERSEGSDDTV